MTENKIRLNTEWLCDCGGCHVALVDLHEKILGVLESVEILKCPVLTDEKKYPEAEIGIVTGSIRTEHDRHAAFISHMPHAISYSLANTVMNQENKRNILALAAGGFRSMSRLAKSSANMWEDIFRQNKTNLLEAITLFEDELKLLKKNIEDDNWDKVHKNIEAGNRLHDILD